MPQPGESALDYLMAQGVSSNTIEATMVEGTLPFLIIETLFAPGVRRYTTKELADRVGQPVEVVMRVRRALGFPDADPDELTGSDQDVAAIAGLLNGAPGRNLTVALDRVRTSAGAMVRLADSIADSFGDGLAAVLESGIDPLLVADAALAEDTPGQILGMLTHVLRHELSAAVRRERHRRTDTPGELMLAVGFIDLVGATARMEELSPAETADLVRRYEAAAFDEIARHGGTVVKMLGDGAVFTTVSVDAAVRIARSLVRKSGHHDMPPARAGVSFGPVIRSQGDVYGPTVNRASRLCDLAPACEVLLDLPAAEQLPADWGTPAGTLILKGIGPTEAVTLVWPG